MEKPLERELMETRPTSREGIVAALDLILREERKNVAGGEVPWMDQYIIDLVENARDALEVGVGTAQDFAHADTHDAVMEYVDRLSPIWQEIERLEEEHTRRFQTLPDELKRLPARSDWRVQAEYDAAKMKRGMPELDRQEEKLFRLRRGIEGVIPIPVD